MLLKEEQDTPATSLPVTDFRAHLRLGTGFSDDDVQDAVLEGFLRAALAAIEARTGKILLTRWFNWTLTDWRDNTAQALPTAPVSLPIEITIFDKSGTAQTVDPATYFLEEDSQRPVLRPIGPSLPTIPEKGRATVRFQSGFGPAWSDLPNDLAQAVLLLASHYYEYRHETALTDGCMPFGVTSLIERYRTVRMLIRGEL